MTAGRFLPCPELLELLRPAFMPCPNLSGCCRGIARWQPTAGHVPRGFVGALGALADVELVLLLAELGDPLPGEVHDITRGVDPLIAEVTRYVYDQLERRRTQFHRSIRSILDRCWPGADLHSQLRRTWITETYLCSAPVESGDVPRAAERGCVSSYLYPQLRLLEDRAIVALGKKAWDRTRDLAVASRIHRAFAAAPPQCNKPVTRESWDAIPGYLAARKARHGQ